MLECGQPTSLRDAGISLRDALDMSGGVEDRHSRSCGPLLIGLASALACFGLAWLALVRGFGLGSLGLAWFGLACMV